MNSRASSKTFPDQGRFLTRFNQSPASRSGRLRTVAIDSVAKKLPDFKVFPLRAPLSCISVKTEIFEMNHLPPVTQKFILHWGEMGTRWGINRTVAQIHALLFTAERPLNAEEICDALGVARSNVSNSLKELQNWGIVRVVHLSGDRRDHFESMQDVYEMFRTIAAERKRREIDPTLAILRECLTETEATADQQSAEAHTRKRMEDLLGFFELATQFYEQMNRLPTQTAVKAFRMGDKLLKAVGLSGS